MKLVINTCYGGFTIKSEIADKYNFNKYHEDRTNQRLIDLIESGVDCNDRCSELSIVEIPDNATDYRIFDYDGVEEVWYVVDGKICTIDLW